MKKRRTLGSVTVTGPPRLIWSWNSGTTEPDEPSTLPKRTMVNTVSGCRVARSCTTSSARRLDAPITLVGRTALSEETRIKRSTPASAASRASVWVPKTLLASPGSGLASTSGTCL